VLHDLAASGRAAEPMELSPGLRVAIDADFGGIDAWRADFGAAVAAHAGADGWTMLALSLRTGMLVNQWRGAGVHARADDDALPLLAFDSRTQGNSKEEIDSRMLGDFNWHVAWAHVEALYRVALTGAAALYEVVEKDMAMHSSSTFEEKQPSTHRTK
jgi:superoxide dismutase, Fe-Mn family